MIFNRFVLASRIGASLLALSMLAGFSASAQADDTSDFFLTISRDDAYSLHKLLERGIGPNLKEPQRGDPGLVLALREHSMKAFRELMAAPKIDLEATSNNGDNALMIAAYSDNIEAVKTLLDRDAEVNKHGWAPLHYAAAIGDCDIMKLLLEKSAYVDAESTNKTTPIMMAARAGQTDAVKLLIEEGADISLKNDLGMTAVDFAKKGEHPDIVELLEAHAKSAEPPPEKSPNAT
jgi:ankyrin repeat protein